MQYELVLHRDTNTLIDCWLHRTRTLITQHEQKSIDATRQQYLTGTTVVVVVTTSSWRATEPSAEKNDINNGNHHRHPPLARNLACSTTTTTADPFRYILSHQNRPISSIQVPLIVSIFSCPGHRKRLFRQPTPNSQPPPPLKKYASRSSKGTYFSRSNNKNTTTSNAGWHYPKSAKFPQYKIGTKKQLARFFNKKTAMFLH